MSTKAIHKNRQNNTQNNIVEADTATIRFDVIDHCEQFDPIQEVQTAAPTSKVYKDL